MYDQYRYGPVSLRCEHILFPLLLFFFSSTLLYSSSIMIGPDRTASEDKIFPKLSTRRSMMMNQIANKAWKVIKPHVPLIQFKKGDRLSQAGSQRSHLDGQNTVKIADDIDLPLKYRRKPMTELEMQMIETGGVPL